MATGVTTRGAAPSGNPIWDAFDTARDDRAQIHCWDDGRYRGHDWDAWRAAAERAGAGLRRRGVRPGARVASVLTNRFEVCAAVVGTWLAGGTLLSMPTLRRGQPAEDYVAQLRRLCAATRPEVMLLEGRFMELIDDQGLGAPVASFESLAADDRFEPAPPADHEPAFVQYSSGSTSEPKGCVLTMGAIGAQERMLQRRLETDGDSHGVMWLPLSHDMGLFGCVLLSWTSGMRLALGTPERFLRTPQTWMDDCAAFQATITVSPNFGLGLAARRARTRPPAGGFPLRTLVLGGERVEWATLTEAVDVLGPCGVTMSSLTPAYGLAEAALAVTMKPVDEQPTAVSVNADAAYRGELRLEPELGEANLAMVSCGPPMDGVSVWTEGGGDIARICVRSDALASGYLDDPERTGRRFVDGHLVTEDVGFVRDGQLYVLGRTDDAIPIGGRNVYARDVELALGTCTGARAGCATLVDVPAGDHTRLVLLAEPSADAGDLVAVADSMAEAVFRAAGVRAEECVLLRPGTLPKTPSGKIQRFRCRALVAADAADVVERVPL